MRTKGFTLVELLIVIGILAILTAAVVIILNPGELLKQARDSQRLSDLDAVKSAIALYLTDVTSPTLSTSTANCYLAISSTTGCNARFVTAVTESINTTRVTDGTGWIPVNLSAITGGSPLASLPVDPTNADPYYYAFASNSTSLTFEINALLESSKYSSKKTSDGGDSTLFYEVGNAPGLNL